MRNSAGILVLLKRGELGAELLRRVEEARSGNVISLEQLWAEVDATPS